MAKKTILKQTGVTQDNKKIFAGIYKFYETHGVPLDVLFSCLIERDCVPDWIDLYKSAKKVGMDHQRIIAKLEEAICDSYGKEFSDHIISNLNKLEK